MPAARLSEATIDASETSKERCTRLSRAVVDGDLVAVVGERERATERAVDLGTRCVDPPTRSLNCDRVAASSPRSAALLATMLAAMRNQEVFGTGLLIVLAATLFGCATPSPEPTNATDVDRAESIATMDDGIAWARSL